MEIKSPAKRLAAFVAIALAIPAVFIFAIIHHARNTSRALEGKASVVAVSLDAANAAPAKLDWRNAYGKLPLSFEANQGQTASAVRFLTRGEGYQLFLTDQEAVLTLRQSKPASAQKLNPATDFKTRRGVRHSEKYSVLRMRLAGANVEPTVEGVERLSGKVNYFIGNDPRNWHTDIPSYSQVKYQGLYPGVDLVFYGNQRQLEYDFVVAPGADPSIIALDVEGARKLAVNTQGDLVMSVAAGKVALKNPHIYQDINGERRNVAGNYVIASDHRIRFAIAGYDHTRPLTIDPVLTYSTYLGGSGSSGDFAAGIALDAAGNAYVAGTTFSTDFPQQTGLGITPADIAVEGTAFVSELNPGGTALVYSTFLGGSGNGSFGEGATAIAVDTAAPTPNIYVTGFTGSPDFPVSAAPNSLPLIGTPGPMGTSTGGSAFVTKLIPGNAGTAQLGYSSYLGGDTEDEGFGIAVGPNANGNVFVVGVTLSTDFKTTPNAISTSLLNPNGSAFLSVISTTAATGSASNVYSTYFGGTNGAGTASFFGDAANGVQVDSNANAYIVGTTTSTNFPHVGTTISSCATDANGIAFVTVISAGQATPAQTYSTCLGGSTQEQGTGIALGPSNIVYVTGQTSSSNFPVTLNSIPPAGTVASGVAFISRINTSSATPNQYSTFLGGTNGDIGLGIAADTVGNAYVTGGTNSSDFPITQGALQPSKGNPDGTGFVSKINYPGGNQLADLAYSSFFGGIGNGSSFPDYGAGIAVDSANNAYITGQTSSPPTGAVPFPVTANAFQSTLNSAATNAFVAELPLMPTISISPTSLPFGIQLIATPSQPQYVTITNNTASAIGLTLPPTTTGPNAGDFAGSASGPTPCTASLAAGASCTIGVIFTPAASGARSATLNIVDALDGSSHPLQVALTGVGSGTAPNITLSPTSLTLPGALLTTTSGPLPVSIGNNGNLPLSISTIAATPGVFTETSNTAACNNGAFPVVIAPGGAPCVVEVSFSPAAATPTGPVTGSLTIMQTGGNVSTVPLAGTAWDFSVSAAAINVTKGMTGSFPVIVTGLGGFTGGVSFTCTPADSLISSCSVPTTNAAPAPGATANGSITAAAFIVPPESMKVPPAALLRQMLFIMLAIGLLFMLPSVRRFRTRFGMMGAMMAFILIAGCSGGTPPPKTTTISITPTSGTVTKTAISVNVTVTQ